MSGGLIVAGAASSNGKTIITLGLLGALRAHGLRVASAKVGPDYIDPTFHERVTGRASYNLDSWAFTRTALEHLVGQASEQADLLIVEGVMGLFDGVAGGVASTADCARILGLPIVLAVDARGAGQSFGAVVRGFVAQAEQEGVQIAGVIANRVASPRHLALLREGLEKAQVTTPLLGCLANDSRLQLPSRHLGLIPAHEQDTLDSAIHRATELIAENCDLDAIQSLATALPVAQSEPATQSSSLYGHEFHYATTEKEDSTGEASPLFRVSDATGKDLGTSGLRQGSVCGSFMHLLSPFLPATLLSGQKQPVQSIAIAKDEAFAFIYPHFLDFWQDHGAKIDFFSPLADEPPPANADFIFLPGGYPELHAEKLAKANRFKAGLREAAQRGVIIYGECGGYMALGEHLTDAQGKQHPMLALLPLATSFQAPKLHLGYRQLDLLAP